MVDPCKPGRHVYEKVHGSTQPEPTSWTCKKCGMQASDTTVILIQIAAVHAKVDRVLELIGTPSGNWSL